MTATLLALLLLYPQPVDTKVLGPLHHYQVQYYDFLGQRSLYA